MSDSLGKRRDKTFQKLAIITNSIIVAAVGITGIVAGVFALTDSSDTNPSGQNSTQPNIPTTNNSATSRSVTTPAAGSSATSNAANDSPNAYDYRSPTQTNSVQQPVTTPQATTAAPATTTSGS